MNLLRSGVGGARGLEGDAHKVLAQHVGEDGLAQRAVLGEHLVHNVLIASEKPVFSDRKEKKKYPKSFQVGN